MQRGVLVCVLLVACHSRQGGSSVSTKRSDSAKNVPKQRPTLDPGTPVLQNNSTYLDSSQQTIFTPLYSTTLPSTQPSISFYHSPNLPKSAKNTGSSKLPTTPFYPSSSLLPVKNLPSNSPLNSQSPSSLPSLPSSSPSQSSTLSSTTFSSLTFSTSNATSLESSTRSSIKVSSTLYFNKLKSNHSSTFPESHNNRTLKATSRQISKKLKFINRVKSVSASSNSSKSVHRSDVHFSYNDSVVRDKAEGLPSLNKYKNQVHPTGVDLTNGTQSLRSISVLTNDLSPVLNKVEGLPALESYTNLVYPTRVHPANDTLHSRTVSVSSMKKIHVERSHPLHVKQVENLRLSLGDTSEIQVGSDVMRNRVGSRDESDSISDRLNLVHVDSSVMRGRAGSIRVGSAINSNLSQSTMKNSEVMSPPPSHVDVSKHTSPITDVNDEERRPNRTEKSWKAVSGGDVTAPRDDYYEYSEYSDFPMKHFNISGFREAAVIPDPDLRDDEAGDSVVESEPEIVLPDDSLADTDLHDHDLIDSVMYIYFGGSPENGRGAGRQVLIVGAVIGLVAQFLTLASAVQRVRSLSREETTVILLHTQLAFTVSNLVFMLGVQATSIAGQCARVALSLHYLHMTAGVWLLINCAHVCLRISVKLRYAVAAWCLPLFYVLGCFIINRRIYETRNFCWMSIHRGLLLSFVAPAFIFLTLNTTLGAIGYTRSRFQCQQSPSVDRKALRIAVVLLPAFIFDWFVEIVALEKSSALVFPLLFVGSKAFINWFIFACWLPSDDSWQDIEDEYDEDYDDFEDDIPPSLMKLKYMVEDHHKYSMDDYKLPYYPGYQSYASDDLPLLQETVETYKCGRRDVCDLQMDPISTICS